MSETWKETLRQEWATARDEGTRQFLLALYQEKLAGLPKHELEQLFEELNDT